MKILLVHGRSQGGKDPVTLKEEWLRALSKGCARANVPLPKVEDVALPFYADRLDALVDSRDLPLEPEIRARGGQDVSTGYLEFRLEVLEDVREAAGVSEAEVAAELPPGERTRGAQHWEWVQAILRALDKHVPAASDVMLERVTRDVWVYLTAPGVRDEVDAIVAEALTNEPTIVVGHSLGSVVAYSVLRRTPNLVVPRFVTVGSPLGILAIRNRFRPLRPPTANSTWFNAYDDRDVVALRGLDAKTFPIQPAIRNKSTVANHTDNRHGIIGYLDDADVAREIAGP